MSSFDSRRLLNIRRAVLPVVEAMESRRLFAASLVSIGVGDVPADGNSGNASVSSNGNLVAFESDATNLVAVDTNGITDIFLRNVSGGTTVRVSSGVGGVPANGRSHSPAISADGAFIAFVSEASNLVAGDNNGVQDIFRYDVANGTISRVSVNTTNGDANSESHSPSISSTGRFIAFVSRASNLFGGTDANAQADVFVRDMTGGLTELVSTPDGDTLTTGAGTSTEPSISANGRFVSFTSTAPNLIASDINNQSDVFLRDTTADTTVLVSATAGGATGAGASDDSRISSDGSLVTFRSTAADLVTFDSNGEADVFLRDIAGGTTTVLSANRARTSVGHGASRGASLSTDERFAAFSSLAPDIVGGDNNAREDIFLRDRTTGPSYLVTASTTNTPANGHSFDAQVSGDGSVVVFSSDASNLVGSDTNGFTDIYTATSPAAAPDTQAPIAAMAVPQPGVLAGAATVDFQVALTDNVALNTVTLGNLNVTGPNAFSTAATLVKVVGSGPNAVATYRFAAPGGTVDTADNGAYIVNVATNAIRDAAGNAAAAGTIGSYTISTADSAAPDLTVQLASALPASVAGGSKGKAVLVVTNQGTNTLANASVATALYASDDATLDAFDTFVGGATKPLTLASGASKNVSLRFSYPATLGNGDYYLIAVTDDDNAVTEPNETNNTNSTTTPSRIAQPSVDVRPEVSPFTGTFTAKNKAVVTITVFNDGNTKVTKPVEMRLFSSGDGTPDSNDDLITTVRRRIGLAGGTSKTVSLRFKFPSTLSTGVRFLGVDLDPLDKIIETNDGNNASTSVTSFTFA